MINELRASIEKRNVILFVGAGVSATLGLPNWSQLISHLADELGYDERIFRLYGDNLLLAEFYAITKGDIKELRNWMETQWVVAPEDIKKSKIYEAIVKLKFPLIYTTNYDHCLEAAFNIFGESYNRIIDVDNLVSSDTNETQIIKFHGDTISDRSIVLTESDYFERLNFNSALDIKLQADMLGKSILFIGYALSDINIRILIYKLDKLWKKSNDKTKRPQSYLFLPTPNPIQEAILNSRGIQTIVGEELNKSKSLEKFLTDLLS